MKATGIVRRVDDLGRVVIPKEIRRTLKIKDGDPLEIYTDTDTVCFKRYNPVGDEKWTEAEKILKHLLTAGFRLYDRDGIDIITSKLSLVEKREHKVEVRDDCGNLIAYLGTAEGVYDSNTLRAAKNIASEILSN